MTQMTLSVQGMTCGHCVKTVESSLGELPGVTVVKVDLKGGRAEVTYDPAKAKPEAIVARIEEEGYKAKIL